LYHHIARSERRSGVRQQKKLRECGKLIANDLFSMSATRTAKAKIAPAIRFKGP
jgi:hypothetical protein